MRSSGEITRVLGTATATPFSASFAAAPNVYEVGPGLPYATIQDAVNAAANARISRAMSGPEGVYSSSVIPDAVVASLSVGERQRVEILKALYREARILILDEPTAVLTPQEAAALFETLRSMAADGRTVIFISHNLQDIFAVSDRIDWPRRLWPATKFHHMLGGLRHFIWDTGRGFAIWQVNLLSWLTIIGSISLTLATWFIGLTLRGVL